MKRIIWVCLMGFASGVLGETNYFTGATNGRLNLDSNWSRGAYTEWDDAVLTADSWGLQGALNAFAEVKFNTITVNGNVNDISVGTFQITAQSAGPIYAKKLTVESPVAKDVRLGGQWYIPTGGAAYTTEINHNGSGALLLYASVGEHVNNPGSLRIMGNDANLVTVGTASTYTGSTTLDNVNVQLAAPATASSGSLGNGGDLVLQDGAILTLLSGSGLNNSSIQLESGTSLDVSEISEYVFSGDFNGTGEVTGDIVLADGTLRAGPGVGTLTFNDSLGMSDTVAASFEFFGDGQFDVIANDGEDTLLVDEDSAWIFNFSNWSGDALTNGQTFAVLDNWGSFSGSSTNITISGLDAGSDLDASNLFITGEVSVIPEPGTVSLFVISSAFLLVVRRIWAD